VGESPATFPALEATSNALKHLGRVLDGGEAEALGLEASLGSVVHSGELGLCLDPLHSPIIAVAGFGPFL
jgi:hypothetical protein